MNSIEKYQGQQVPQEIVHLEGSAEYEKDTETSLITPIRRRWKTLMAIFLLVSAIGVPIVWITVKPFYQATAAIRVIPVISSILFMSPLFEKVLYLVTCL